MRIGYLGPKGTFTHYACLKSKSLYFDKENWDLVEFLSLNRLFDALEKGTVDAIFSPLENSIEGPVNRVLDGLLQHSTFRISSVFEMPIQQSLLGFSEDIKISEIEHIVSMPHAIAQCYDFIKQHCPDVKFHHSSSTAGSVPLVDALKLPKNSTVIIGHHGICDYFPIKLRKKNIHDQKDNKTQFCLIQQSPDLNSNNSTHGLIAFSTPKDQPGSLLSVLEIFNKNKINLTKILSRPKKSEPGAYVFYIEFLIDSDTLSTIDLFPQIKEKCLFFKELGHYRSQKIND